MEQLQQREWYELQSRTWQLLRGRDHILRAKHRPLLQYLVRPSFTDTWSIDFVRTGDNLAAFHTVWRMTEDIHAFTTAIERLKHPKPYVPTLASTRIDLGSNAIESMLHRLGQIQIPLQQTKNSISLDGVSYELQIGDGWTGVMLQWHNELPDEWPTELRRSVEDIHEMETRHAVHASEQSDARERRSRANLQWTINRRRGPVNRVVQPQEGMPFDREPHRRRYWAGECEP